MRTDPAVLQIIKEAVHGAFTQILDAAQHGEQVSIQQFGRFIPYLCREKHIRSGLSTTHYVVPPRWRLRFRPSETADRDLNQLKGVVYRASRQTEKPAPGQRS
jgi:nucleoid DNA-binding protein